jgi:hypothetical protein
VQFLRDLWCQCIKGNTHCGERIKPATAPLSIDTATKQVTIRRLISWPTNSRKYRSHGSGTLENSDRS